MKRTRKVVTIDTCFSVSPQAQSGLLKDKDLIHFYAFSLGEALRIVPVTKHLFSE